MFTRQGDGAEVKCGVLVQLRVSRFRDGQTLDFVVESLTSTNVFVRTEALQFVGSLDSRTKLRFADQLRSIARNSQEPDSNRATARLLLTTLLAWQC